MYHADVKIELISMKLARNVGGIRSKLDQLGLYEKIDPVTENAINDELTILIAKYDINQIYTILLRRKSREAREAHDSELNSICTSKYRKKEQTDLENLNTTSN
jgi:hypothetical protein